VACGPHQFLGNGSSDLPLGSNVYEKSGEIGAWFPNRQPKQPKNNLNLKVIEYNWREACSQLAATI
jgi:hypothetical protein